MLLGGAQESGRRAGTENVPAIGGFGRAAELAYGDLDAATRVAGVRDGVETALKTRVPPIEIHGAGMPRLPNTSCFGLDGYKAETQLMALDLAGVAVSAGSACSSGKMRPSHVLLAMGVPADRAACAIRVSIGPATTPLETSRLVDSWAASATRRQGEAA
jgi:cysteine desulfurase